MSTEPTTTEAKAASVNDSDASVGKGGAQELAFEVGLGLGLGGPLVKVDVIVIVLSDEIPLDTAEVVVAADVEDVFLKSWTKNRGLRTTAAKSRNRSPALTRSNSQKSVESITESERL